MFPNCKNENEVYTAFDCLTVFLFTAKYQQNARHIYSIQYVPINVTVMVVCYKQPYSQENIYVGVSFY